ncbi:MAG: PQQ-binding-like beta-propeller repeat protein, partial [Planctomycetota bacterium]
MDTRSTSRLPARASCGALLSLVAAALTAGGGCRSGENTTASATDTGPTAAAVTETTGPIDLETRYLIGPDAARTLDYRIDWQVHALAAGQRGLRSVTAQYDSLFVLDEQNYLTRFRREDGQRLWRIPVSNAWEEILGVNFMPDVDRIYLTTGGALLELDALTGSTVGQQPLEKVANTAPVRAGTFLIYGARNGQLVWHAFPVAFQWRAYQISRSIQMKPLLY